VQLSSEAVNHLTVNCFAGNMSLMDFCLTDFRGIIGCLIVNIFCDIVVPIAHGSRCETD